MVVEIIDMVPIIVYYPTIIHMPITWVIAPIVRRMPTVPTWSPEPIVDDRSINIDRFDYIVCSIEVFIANNLYSYLLRRLIFFDIYTCYILIDVFCKYCLQYNKVGIVICRFYYSQVINLSVAV